MLFLTVFLPSRSITYIFGTKKTVSASKYDNLNFFLINFVFCSKITTAHSLR